MRFDDTTSRFMALSGKPGGRRGKEWDTAKRRRRGRRRRRMIC
jgi:hypothetical protein